MPDHFHVLITLRSEMTVEKAAQLIKGGFAFRAGRELGFQAPVWQKGFSEIRVTTSDSFLRLRDYIQANPGKRFLVATPEQYPYSSAFLKFELDPPPLRLKPFLDQSFGGIAEAMP